MTVPTTSTSPGVGRPIRDICYTLESIGIIFMSWYSDSPSTLPAGRRHLVALSPSWATTADRFLVLKSDGDATYILAGDLAYHRDKFLILWVRSGY